MQLRSYFIGILILMALLLGVMAVSAQDATPIPPTLEPIITPEPTLEPATPPLDVIPVEKAGYELLAVIVAIIGSVASAPATLFVVSVLKRIPFLTAIPARTLQILVAGILVVGVWAARFFGVDVQFNSLLSTIQVAGPVVLQFVLTLLGSHAAYSYAAFNDVPIIGYTRPQSVPMIGRSAQKGQGLVEYALILVLVAVVVIVILALLGPAIGNIFSNIVTNIQCGGFCTPIPQ